jgi:Transcriptional antiterminator
MNQYINERCKNILKVLLDKNQPITIGKISEELDVSNRTIRYDLEELDDFLKDYDDINIRKKSRVGIWLECSEEKLNYLKEIIHNDKAYIKPFSAEERTYYIISQLIQAIDIVKMQNLANELYVSRTTIYNDLNEVEKWLNKFDLNLIRKQNYGLQISGEEKNLRKAASELVVVFKNNEELKSIMEQSNEHYESRVNPKYYKKVKEFVPEIDLAAIERILREAEDKLDFHLTDEAFEGLFVHIAISIKRLNYKKDLEFKDEQLMSLKNTKEYKAAQWLVNKFKDELYIAFTENETAYLALHILGAKIQKNDQFSDEGEIIEGIDNELKSFTKELISLVSNILGYNLNNDRNLYNGLILHLRPAINRMTYGLSLRNPLINEIKKQFSTIFSATWAVSTLFEKFYHINVSEEELGYIVLHIGAALERLDTSIKVIVVCSSGIGTSQLVEASISKQIPNIEVLGTYSMLDVKELDKEKFDAVISTVPIEYLEDYDKPIIKISPLISDEELSEIKKLIKSIEKKKAILDINKNKILNNSEQLFYDDLIFLKEKAESKVDILSKVSQVFIEKEFVRDGFNNSVIDREKITSTAVGKKVAIPHGAENLVKKSCIAIITLEDPIKWGEEEVDIIFLLALKVEDKNFIKSFFSHFSSILHDDDILRRIRESSDKNEILGLLSIWG